MRALNGGVVDAWDSSPTIVMDVSQLDTQIVLGFSIKEDPQMVSECHVTRAEFLDPCEDEPPPESQAVGGYVISSGYMERIVAFARRERCLRLEGNAP